MMKKSEEVFGLPNIKSAKKRVLVNATKAAQNKAQKSALKTQLKKFEAAVAGGNRSEADAAYKVAVKAVDQAAANWQAVFCAGAGCGAKSAPADGRGRFGSAMSGVPPQAEARDMEVAQTGPPRKPSR